MFAQGSFTNDPNATPESIARKRALIRALMPQFGSARYVGEGIGQLATGIGMGLAGRKMNKTEDAGRKSAAERFASIFSGGQFGGTEMGGAPGMPGGTWTPNAPGPKPTDLPPGMGQTPLGNDPMPLPQMRTMDPTRPAPVGEAVLGFGSATMTPQEMLIAGAKARGLDPIDVATAISYETGGKFDPLIKGPTTQWGTHEGLIQFGDPQGQQHGAVFDQGPEVAMRSQLDPQNGAVWSYLDSVGVKPGMGLDQIYSGINAGGINRMSASDANNGGAPGTVADKVAGMGPHREKAAAFLGGTWTPAQGGDVSMSAQGAPQPGGMSPSGFSMGGPAPDQLIAILTDPWASQEEKAIAAQFLQRSQQQQDPAYQMGLEKQRLELAQMQNGGGGNVPAGFRELDMRAQAAGLQPGSQEYQQFMASGGAGLKEGRPAAFEALHQQALAAGLQEGTPEYRQFMLTKGAGDAAFAREAGTQRGAAASSLPQAEQIADQVTAQIDGLINDPYLPEMLGPVTSRLPNVSANSARVQARMDQMQGGVFLQARDLLKGGGQITDYEGKKAEDAFARMSAAQNFEDYVAALNEFKAAVSTGLAKLQQKAGQPPERRQPATGAQPAKRLRFNPATGAIE